MKKIILLLTIVLFWTMNASTQTDFNKAGRTSLQFLKIGIGARSTALSEACIANIQDIEAVFWNPASLTGIDNLQAGFSYTKWFGDLSFTAGAIGYNLSDIGVFAFHYIALDYGDIQEALVTSPTGGIDTRTGKNFGGSDISVGLAFSREYTDKLSIGLQLKYLREELFTYSSSLWAFDVGSYYNTGWKGIRLAMSAQNFARQARWLYTKERHQQTYELPLLFRVGWSIDLMGGENLFFGGDPTQHRFTLNMDALHSNDYAERFHIGGEYWMFDRLALRGGYRVNYDEGNLSLGAGIKLDTGTLNLRVDYAYVNYDFLDSPHRVSMILTF